MHHVLRGSLYKPRRRVSAPRPWCVADPEGSSTRKRSRDGGCSAGPAAHPVSLCLSLGQYKASYSRHFISPDKQERQDKEIFRQNMKRRLETFKSTKHNVCSSKSKARLKEKGRKKASAPQMPAPFLALGFALPRDADSEVLRGVGKVLQGSSSSRAAVESSSSPLSPAYAACERMGVTCPCVPTMLALLWDGCSLGKAVPSPGGAPRLLSKSSGHKVA